MSKIFNIYLSFLGILLFSGVVNLYANMSFRDNYLVKNFETVEFTNQISTDGYKNDTYFSASKQENKEGFPVQIIEVEEIEDEEPSEDENLITFNPCKDKYYSKTQIINFLSFQQDRELTNNKNYFYIPSTKLHVRFQVFTI